MEQIRSSVALRAKMNVDGRYLGDPLFAHVCTELDRRGAVCPVIRPRRWWAQVTPSRCEADERWLTEVNRHYATAHRIRRHTTCPGMRRRHRPGVGRWATARYCSPRCHAVDRHHRCHDDGMPS